jgi:nucleotidyltransferase substrate binding protein (TIGR01987 family)
MRAHAVSEAENGSPREILKAGFRFSFLDDESTWLQMLKDRNSAMHIYDEQAFISVLDRVYDSYIKTFDAFAEKMRTKVLELEG